MVIFNNMDESENKFLHSINLDTLKRETGLTIEEIARAVGVGPKVVYKWQYMHKDGSRPDFNAIIKLLNAGASVETLFGVNYKPQLPETAIVPSQDFLNNPSVKEGLDNAFEAFLVKKGLIKKSEG